MASCTPAPHIAELSQIGRTLRSSPSGQGFSHLGSDGVYRSFSSSLQVIDYKPLSPEEISGVLRAFKAGKSAEEVRELEGKWKGVDERDAQGEELLRPAPGVMPHRPSS